MDKITKAKYILEAIGMPKRQQTELCSLILLALAGIRKHSAWNSATNEWTRVHDIIKFVKQYYGKEYAENSRETFRKKVLHHFRTAAIVEDNGLATNSPKYSWRLTEEFLQVVRAGGAASAVKYFCNNHARLIDIYASKKRMEKLPVKINGKDFTFSPGKHNELQKAILEVFAPKFAENSECLYVGDTVKKDLVKREDRLKELGFKITLHDKMPDVVLYREDKNWIYFIEAYFSGGPMDPKRILELTEMTKNVTAGKIFVTVFLDFKTYKSHSHEIAWETEVWIAEIPDHMIHLNGDKFLGPR